MPDVVIYL